MANPNLSNGTCYSSAKVKADSQYIPCGNVATGEDFPCCEAGDDCLSNNACYNESWNVTYLAGCTDPSFKADACPSKGALAHQQWVGLLACELSADDPTSMYWVLCSESKGGKPISAPADPCNCSGKQPAFYGGPSLADLALLPGASGSSISWFPGHAPTSAGGDTSTGTGESGSASAGSSTTGSPTTAAAATTGTTASPAGGTAAATSSTGAVATTLPATAASPTNTAAASSPSSSSSSPPAQAGLSTGAKAGIGVGVGAGSLMLASLVAVAVVLRRRRSSSSNNAEKRGKKKKKKNGGNLASAESPPPLLPPMSVPPAPAQPLNNNANNNNAMTSNMNDDMTHRATSYEKAGLAVTANESRQTASSMASSGESYLQPQQLQQQQQRPRYQAYNPRLHGDYSRYSNVSELSGSQVGHGSGSGSGSGHSPTTSAAAPQLQTIDDHGHGQEGGEGGDGLGQTSDASMGPIHELQG